MAYNPVETFFQEAEELVADIEQSALGLCAEEQPVETVNRLFRAFHTIKGSGAMCGLDAVAAFTHHVESLLDRVRSGETPVSAPLAELVLQATDHIRALLNAAQGGAAVSSGSGEKLIAVIAEFANPGAASDNTGVVAPAPRVTENTVGTERTWSIRFHPNAAFLANGGNPAALLKDLRRLGSCDVTAHTDLSEATLNMNRNRPIRVLIVDDSAFVRQALKGILETDPQIEVIAVAADPYAAVERIKAQLPDVITLDVEMPRMDGLTFLERLMSQHPIPVVICSTLTAAGSDMALEALAKGAVDIVTKPKLGTKEFFEEARAAICEIVKSAAHARLGKCRPAPAVKVDPKLTADAVLAKPTSAAMIQTTEKVVAVGASTGGTEALREFLQALPLDAPGIVIVQHMPEEFTARFAQRLDQMCRVTVKEAEDNDSVIRGQALIAPGNRHVLLKRSGARYFVELRDGPLVSRHRPSVDVLFRSAARYAGRNALGVIMTGMGDDGSKGMLEMKQAGAFNIAQDESSCVVFGMPAEAIKAGAVDRVMPLDRIAPEVVRLCKV